MKPFYWFIRFWVKCLFKLFYRHKVYGIDNLIPGSGMIAANHASYLDPELISISAPEEIFFLARKGLFEVPFFGFFIRQLNAVPVSGTTEDLNTFKIVKHLLQEGKKVVIFPEGERSLNNTLGDFKRGVGMMALQAKCPIIPTYIHGAFQAWPATKRFPRFLGIRTACIFGTPIPWNCVEHLDKREAQEVLTQRIEKSVHDLKAWYLAGANGTPP